MSCSCSCSCSCSSSNVLARSLLNQFARARPGGFRTAKAAEAAKILGGREVRFSVTLFRGSEPNNSAFFAAFAVQFSARPRRAKTRGPRVPCRSRPPNQPIQVRRVPSSFWLAFSARLSSKGRTDRKSGSTIYSPPPLRPSSCSSAARRCCPRAVALC